MEQTKLYTMKDLCAYLGIGRNTALTLINSGEIKAFKAGRHWLIPETSIEEYIHDKTYGNARTEEVVAQKDDAPKKKKNKK